MTQVVPAAMADTDIVKITGAQTIGGVKTFSSQPNYPAQSMVRLNTANGYGSTNTKIRRFTTVVTNQGSDITYADSATLGASFTINTNGVYSVCYSDQFTSAGWVGLSLNTAAPTTSMPTISASEILVSATSSTAAGAGVASWVGYLAAGAIVRAHTDGVATGGNANAGQFTITRVA